MSTSQNLTVNWKNVPTRTITAGGVEFAYRELGTNNPRTPVVFLVHLLSDFDGFSNTSTTMPASDESVNAQQHACNTRSSTVCVIAGHSDFLPSLAESRRP